jgi:8-oxo-dGTP diphosphatase
MAKIPRVGIGTIIMHNNKVLLLKRKGSHGSGTWAFIGGHLEFKETPEEGAAREAFEEIGIKIKNPRAVAFTNDFFPKEKKHYITLYVIADFKGDKITIKEPEKIEAVEWFSWNKFPSPLFVPLKNLRKENFNPFKL